MLGIGEGGTRCSHGGGLGKNHLSFLELTSIICLENNNNNRNIGLHWPFLAWNVRPQHRYGPRELRGGSRVTALAPEDQYVPTRGWELLICGSYPASVFYLAHSISQVLVSSLFHIKSELLISLEKSDSIAPLSLHSPQPASVQVSPLPPPHTHFGQGARAPGCRPAAPYLTVPSHGGFIPAEAVLPEQFCVGVFVCVHSIPSRSEGLVLISPFY